MVAFPQTIPIPENESDRIQALDELDILDTPDEERFDRITRLASQLVDAPIVLISLVDEDRQWFKSRVGLEAQETPREFAFCTHAIMDSDVFVVPDATEDGRFRENPLVTGQPAIRFYAGAPLEVDEGVRIGTLCAIDTKPRELEPKQEKALYDLAQIVVDELKLRRHIVELGQTREALEHANESLRQFAHVAAHDLRAPVKTLVTMSDIVLTSSGERRERGLRMIREAAMQAESLITGYRRLSDLRLGERVPARVSELVRDAKTRLESPPEVVLKGDATLHCDAVLMQQVFVNLLQNAARHGADHRITISILDPGGSVFIRASNRPEGSFTVDQSVLAPFKQMSNETEGSGLGLSIVDRIVRLHGGSVHVIGDQDSFAVEMSFPGSAAARTA